jgi:hypothetical protein
LIEGLLFDFWPISWDMLDGFSTGRIRGWSFAPALVHDIKVLYSRSKSVETRLNAIQQQVIALQQPDAQPRMIQRALEQLPSIYTALGKLRVALASGHFTDLRLAGGELILAVLECLALINQQFYTRGYSGLFAQIERFEIKPENAVSLITTLSTSDDPTLIAKSADMLGLEVHRMLSHYQAASPTPHTACDLFRNAYPEINAQLGKILTACEKQHPFEASSAAMVVQQEIGSLLCELDGTHPDAHFFSEYAKHYFEIDLPDLISLDFNQFETVSKRVKQFDSVLRRWLSNQSVSLNEYDSLEAFAQSLELS